MKYIIFTTGAETLDQIKLLATKGEEVTIALITDSGTPDEIEAAQARYGDIPVQDAIKVIRALKKVKPDEYMISSDGTPETDQYLDHVKTMGFDVIPGEPTGEPAKVVAPEGEVPPVADAPKTPDVPPPPTEPEVNPLAAELEEAKNLITELQDKIAQHGPEVEKLKADHAGEIQKIKDSIAELLNED